MNKSNQQIIKLINCNGTGITEIQEVIKNVKEYYKTLYDTTRKKQIKESMKVCIQYTNLEFN